MGENTIGVGNRPILLFLMPVAVGHRSNVRHTFPGIRKNHDEPSRFPWSDLNRAHRRHQLCIPHNTLYTSSIPICNDGQSAWPGKTRFVEKRFIDHRFIYRDPFAYWAKEQEYSGGKQQYTIQTPFPCQLNSYIGNWFSEGNYSSMRFCLSIDRQFCSSVIGR